MSKYLMLYIVCATV